jgi:hypothetical protein
MRGFAVGAALARACGSDLDSLFPQIKLLAAGRPIFNADLYVIDGGSGKVRAIVDYWDLQHWLDQSDTTKQCALPAAHADFQGKLCLTFVSASATRYQSNRSAASWGPYTRDGTPGAEICAALTPTDASGTRIVLSTGTSGNREQLDYAPGTGVVRWHAGAITCAGAVTTNVPTYWAKYYQEGLSPEVATFVKGTPSTTSPENPNTPPETSLVLGSAASGGNAAGMRFVFLMFWPVLSAGGRSTVRQYTQQTYGIAA